MQDIPRNELLDKLAAGWKVRRSVWPKEQTISKNGGSITVAYTELIEDDWEGEPQSPICVYCELTVDRAFVYLQEDRYNLKFVRRKSWPCHKLIRDNHDNVALATKDLVAEDWEVWG
jgi:hypothetical protein